MDQKMEPLLLAIPDPIEKKASRDWLDRLLVIGWWRSFRRQMNWMNAAMDNVRIQLEQRPAFPANVWAEAKLNPTRAEAIARALWRRLDYLPNHYFLPDDPFGLLTLDWEGMGPFEAWFTINKELSVNLPLETFLPEQLFRAVVAAVGEFEEKPSERTGGFSGDAEIDCAVLVLTGASAFGPGGAVGV